MALMMREMSTRYGRSLGGYVWAILEPVGMIAIMTLVFSFVVKTPPLGTNFPLFFATGFLGFSFFMELAGFASAAVYMNIPLLNYPRVTPMDTVMARCLLQLITLCFISIIIFLTIIFFYELHLIYDYILIFKSIFYASALGIGTGVTNAVIFAYVPTYENIWKILTRPLFLISGVFFIPENLPPAAVDILWFNPVLHVVGMMRQGFYSSYDAQWLSELYLAGLAFILLSVGLFLISFNRTKMIERR